MEDWLGRLKQALDYIEDNLDGQVDTARAAQIACCSVWHFTRMFGYITGVPLAEYIRRRRLTLAGLELAGGQAKVLDVALKYGYDSPTAFTRAFRALHGIPPSAARRPGSRLRAWPRISFQIQLKGEVDMVYRIETRPAFTVVGYKKPTTTEDGRNLKEIPQMWHDMTPEMEGTLAGIMEPGEGPVGFLGICANMQGPTFDYYLAVASTRTPPAGMEALPVPAATWAVFESVGPVTASIQEVWRRIYAEWFPTAGYHVAPGGLPDLEVYPAGDINAADYRCEVWIAVERDA